jgi:GDPmannose 4,6-dehydratase
VTRKVTAAVARIWNEEQDCVYLGNLNAKRDWGWAPDYVRAMWLMLQKPEPGDYVVATGECHSVRDWVDAAFLAAGVSLMWEGVDDDEVARDTATDKVVVRVDPRYYRPLEVNVLRGDSRKAQSLLDWRPTVTFKELVRQMVDADMAAVGVPV